MQTVRGLVSQSYVKLTSILLTKRIWQFFYYYCVNLYAPSISYDSVILYVANSYAKEDTSLSGTLFMLSARERESEEVKETHLTIPKKATIAMWLH